MKELEEIKKTFKAQIDQALEDAKAGKISVAEFRRIVLADTQNSIDKLKDLLPKKDVE